MSQIIMKNICVVFPGVKALQNVDCEFRGGEVKAVVGANGAGKSTLMKVLSGVNSNYTGDITIDGKPVQITNTKVAKDLGIEIVYQEVDTALVPNLSVGENIMMDYLTNGIGKAGIVNWAHLHKTATEMLQRLELPITSRQMVATLTLAQKQMVVIARAMMGKCRFLILDEPTAPLSQKETEQLFDLVRRLKADGVGIIFISHRLNELFEICDTITVLRDGQHIKTFDLDKSITQDYIVELMLGKVFDQRVDKSGRSIGDDVLETRKLSDSRGAIHDIDIHVRKGEIIGVSGLVGAGKTELCKTLFGAFGKYSGEILVNGKTVVNNSPSQAVKNEFAFVPEERRKEGILVGETITNNLSAVTLGKYSGLLAFINKKAEDDAAQEKIRSLTIKTPSSKQKVGLLSGGNQQKVVIGKWLDSDAAVYIFDEPTKGIDVGAKGEVYKLIVELARQGKAVIYATDEFSEIMNLTDRVYVMYNGRVQQELITEKTNENELLFYSTGGQKK